LRFAKCLLYAILYTHILILSIPFTAKQKPARCGGIARFAIRSLLVHRSFSVGGGEGWMPDRI
jgi:hypothetical protein